MVVMMPHADDRHRSTQPQLASEPLRRVERTGDVARVHRHEILRPQEDAARRQFLDDAAQQGGGECDVVPACDERMDLHRLDADPSSMASRGVQALFRPAGAVANAGVALLLIVTDHTDAVGLRGLYQGDAAVVARGPYAGQIDALAASQLLGEGRAASRA